MARLIPFAALALASVASVASASSDNGLARTPPLGWMSWRVGAASERSAASTTGAPPPPHHPPLPHTITPTPPFARRQYFRCNLDTPTDDCSDPLTTNCISEALYKGQVCAAERRRRGGGGGGYEPLCVPLSPLPRSSCLAGYVASRHQAPSRGATPRPPPHPTHTLVHLILPL